MALISAQSWLGVHVSLFLLFSLCCLVISWGIFSEVGLRTHGTYNMTVKWTVQVTDEINSSQHCLKNILSVRYILRQKKIIEYLKGCYPYGFGQRVDLKKQYFLFCWTSIWFIHNHLIKNAVFCYPFNLCYYNGFPPKFRWWSKNNCTLTKQLTVDERFLALYHGKRRSDWQFLSTFATNRNFSLFILFATQLGCY